MNRFLIVFVFITEIFVCVYAKCPEGMISSFSDNSICFLLVSQKQSYLIAEKYCNQQNGHLTSIHDGIDNALIREESQKNFTDSTSGDFWIGINNLETSGFSWFDKTPLDFVDWDNKQPQNNPGYNCGAIKLQGGAWITDDCDKQKSSVCIIKTSDMTTTTVQGKTTLKPKACPPSWVHYDVTGFCYLVVNETLQWGDAEDWCFSHGAHLASIHSLAENAFVTNMIPFDPNEHGCNTKQWAYIGLYSVTNQQH